MCRMPEITLSQKACRAVVLHSGNASKGGQEQRFVPGDPGDPGADGVNLVPNVLKIWAGSRATKCGKTVSDP